MQIDFSSLLVRPPGDALYYLAIMAINLAGLGMAYGHRSRYQDDRAGGRYFLAALGTVAAWVVLMLGALYALLTNQRSDSILPLLERVVQTVAFALAIWAYASADHDRWERIPNIFLLAGLLLIAIFYVVQGGDWATSYAEVDFNLSQLGLIWTIIPVVLATAGALLMLVYFHIIVDSPLKFIYFLLLIPGFVATLLQTARGNIIGDYAGLVRLSVLAASPIFVAVAYRHIITYLDRPQSRPEARPTNGINRVSAPVPTLASQTPTTGERESAQLMRALGLMLENATPRDIPERISTATLNVLKTDIAVLMRVSSATHADVLWGLDRVMEQPITSISVNLDDQPTLVNAIERRQQRPLFPDRNVDELRDLYARFDIEAVGPTYFQPLVNGTDVIAVLILGLPYSRRELTDGERELLKGIAIIGAKLMALSEGDRAAEIAASVIGVMSETMVDDGNIRELTAELDESRRQIGELIGHVNRLRIELDDERTRIEAALDDTEESQSISQRITALMNEQQQIVEERDRLASRLRDAETALIGAVSTDNEAMLKSMIDVLQSERDDLTVERDRLQTQIEAFRSGGPVPLVVQDLLDRLSRERAHLEHERQSLLDRLNAIEDQLRALGVTDGARGLAQLIQQLYEQRATLQMNYDLIKQERDSFLQEREHIVSAIQDEEAREQQLKAMQVQISYLAADREAAIKQRDKYRSERDDLSSRQGIVQDRYARVMAEIASYEQEVAELRGDQGELKGTVESLREQQMRLIDERDRLSLQLRTIEAERAQFGTRDEGDRARLQEMGASGVSSLLQMIDDLAQQRTNLEKQLQAAEQSRTESTAQTQPDRAEQRSASTTQEWANAPQPENSDAMLGMIQELRTPLTSVIGYVDLLLNETAGILGEMQRRFLQRVASNSTRLSQMLEDLSRLVMLDAGDVTLETQRINPVGIIEDAITHATPQLRERSVVLHLDLPDDAITIQGDKDALHQIVTQLLTNACLASPAGGEISISARVGQNEQDRGMFIVSVTDQGGGIDPQDEPRVFARRYKADNPLLQGLGDTGVGLAIAKTLVEAQGGRIALKSQQGVGTTFRFALPVDAIQKSES